MNYIVGIDPSQRHTGVCILDQHLKVLEVFDIVTGATPILESGIMIRDQIGILFKKYPDALYCMEKMMPGATCGPLLFYVQMIILESMAEHTSKRLVHPLPVQLRSYMKKLLGKVPENKTATVQGFRELTSFKGRVSSHCADAYFAARMGDEVVNNRYSYRLSEKELPIMSWGVINGER